MMISVDDRLDWLKSICHVPFVMKRNTMIGSYTCPFSPMKIRCQTDSLVAIRTLLRQKSPSDTNRSLLPFVPYKNLSFFVCLSSDRQTDTAFITT